jgi:hypothetical protein
MIRTSPRFVGEGLVATGEIEAYEEAVLARLAAVDKLSRKCIQGKNKFCLDTVSHKPWKLN